MGESNKEIAIFGIKAFAISLLLDLQVFFA